ncbi:MAG: MBL fold metallo-hydrolase [Spirochaetes bacterium]|nr:MBL fold metallo-hydrolase [Spirochaetota bacterium]MBU1079514.1 MBL fold metallo-hydrolase [Spirochaetota bacterium]
MRLYSGFKRAVSALAIAVALLAGSAVPSFAQEALRVDRLGSVLDASGDAGKLVARFWKLSLPGGSDEKSGDSALLVSPEGKTMLIDGGAPSCGSQVSAYLRAMGLDAIDVVVASHPHVDHIGGLAAVLREFRVGVVYMSRLEYPTRAFADFLAAAGENNARIVYLEAGDTFYFGGSVEVTVLNPEPGITYYDGYPANGTQFVNDRSLVMRFAYGSSSMLFMGDVYSSRELDLIGSFGDALRSDVMKAGHHGSDTSSSKSLIRAVSPRVAVMMHDNLASMSVYRNYRKAGSEAFVTCIDGCVKVSVDGSGGVSVVTQFDRNSDFLE